MRGGRSLRGNMNFELCFYTFSTYFYVQNSCVQNCFGTFVTSFFSYSICFLQRAEDWKQCEVWTLILNSDTIYLWYGHISSDDILLICSSGFSYFEHWSPSSDCSFFVVFFFFFFRKMRGGRSPRGNVNFELCFNTFSTYF